MSVIVFVVVFAAVCTESYAFGSVGHVFVIFGVSGFVRAVIGVLVSRYHRFGLGLR